MNKLRTLRQKQDAFAQLQAELSALENDKELKKEQAFYEEAKELLEKHNRTVEDFAEIFELSYTKQRAKRVERTFKHPQTNEVVKGKNVTSKVRQWAADLQCSVDELEIKAA